MRSTFFGFEASKTAIFSSQKSLDIVGHNLSNMTTEGYTRQRVEQVAKDAGSYNSRLKVNQADYSGMGVDINGVAQIRSKALDNSFRQEYSDVGYFEQKKAMLSDVEAVLQELDIGDDGNGYGLSYALKQVYTSLQDFSANPSSPTEANIVSSSFKNMALALRQVSSDLTDSANLYKNDLNVAVTEVNEKIEEIAKLNETISKSAMNNNYNKDYGPNELMDKRNLLVDELSAFGKTKVEYKKDGTIDLDFNGTTVVKGKDVDRLMYKENSDQTVTVSFTSDGKRADLENGSLKAMTDLLNGRGMNVTNGNESSERGYLHYMDKLNTFASKITDVANNTIPDEFDDDGNIVSYKKILGAEIETENGFEVFPEILVTASNISLSDELSSSPNYLIQDDSSRDNTYILQMITRLTTNEYQFENTGNGFKGNFADFVNDYTSSLGGDLSYTTIRSEAAQNVSNEILNNRDSISGVSESEETVNMMTYNRAFQAASRMMTVMDDLLNVIINQMAV